MIAVWQCAVEGKYKARGVTMGRQDCVWMLGMRLSTLHRQEPRRMRHKDEFRERIEAGREDSHGLMTRVVNRGSVVWVIVVVPYRTSSGWKMSLE